MRLLSFLLFFALPVFALADSVQDYETSSHQIRYGDYEINYSLFNTTFLSPEVAESYGIVRSEKKALLNISVVKLEDNGTRREQIATVSGTEFDLIIKKDLVFRTVKEKNGIYHLASIDIQNKVPLYFSITIQPDPALPPYTLKFRKKLYAQ